MSNLIPKSFIDDTVDRTSITEYISQFTTLKSASSGEKVGLCPMPSHEEKTPSFYVNESKGTYNCFGCGCQGNVVNFIMDLNNESFLPAFKRLAKYHNVKIPYSTASKKKSDGEWLNHSAYQAVIDGLWESAISKNKDVIEQLLKKYKFNYRKEVGHLTPSEITAYIEKCDIKSTELTEQLLAPITNTESGQRFVVLPLFNNQSGKLDGIHLLSDKHSIMLPSRPYSPVHKLFVGKDADCSNERLVVFDNPRDMLSACSEVERAEVWAPAVDFDAIDSDQISSIYDTSKNLNFKSAEFRLSINDPKLKAKLEKAIVIAKYSPGRWTFNVKTSEKESLTFDYLQAFQLALDTAFDSSDDYPLENVVSHIEYLLGNEFLQNNVHNYIREHAFSHLGIQFDQDAYYQMAIENRPAKTSDFIDVSPELVRTAQSFINTVIICSMREGMSVAFKKIEHVKKLAADSNVNFLKKVASSLEYEALKANHFMKFESYYDNCPSELRQAFLK